MSQTTKTQSHRLGRGAIPACVGAAIVVLGSTGASGAIDRSPHAALSPNAAIAAMKSAIRLEPSVRLNVKIGDSKTHMTDEEVVEDAGKKEGEQTLEHGSGLAYIRLISNTAYFSGNTSGLTTFFDMPAADEAKVGSKWVTVKKGDPDFADFSGLLISSVTTGVVPKSKKVTATSSTYNGVADDVLRWGVTQSGTPISYTLDINAKSHLPILETETAGTNIESTSFSHWAEHIALKTPTDTIALSAVS